MKSFYFDKICDKKYCLSFYFFFLFFSSSAEVLFSCTGSYFLQKSPHIINLYYSSLPPSQSHILLHTDRPSAFKTHFIHKIDDAFRTKLTFLWFVFLPFPSFRHVFPPLAAVFAGGANNHCVRDVSFSPDGSHIATVCDDK